MIAMLIAAQAVTLGASNYSVDAPMVTPTAPPDFADEFADAAVDRRTWRFDTSRNAMGWSNGERQYYADGRPANARVEDGALVIEARVERLSKAQVRDWGGQDYTSARLVTRVPLGPGFFEVRAKLPCGRGIWPAIWMRAPYGRWPDSGEIDIMEMVGWKPGVVHSTLHTAAFNHARNTQRGAQRQVPTACTEFHRYQLDWRADTITVGVDGRAFMRIDNDQPGGADAWPFTRAFNLILNVAVGGDWAGQEGVDDAAFPQRMSIDYVRHWTRPTVTGTAQAGPERRPHK